MTSSVSRSSVAAALGLVREGRVFDLASGWWRGMPMAPPHPRFELLSFRTPHGQQLEQDIPFLARERNSVNYGFASELMLACMHSGTHIDALSHISCGNANELYGGESADSMFGDFGARALDASELPPIIARGVMLDIAALVGVEVLSANYSIDADHLERACAEQGVSIEPGDVVLIRTGQMRYWPDEAAMARHADAGVSIDGARWLSKRSPSAVGGDTVALEVAPSGIDGDPQPVHVHLIRDCGIPILEWVNCEELSAHGIHVFAFIALPLTVRGATGSMIRPVAVV